MDLGRSGLLSRVSLIGSGSSGFGEDNPPSDLPKSVFCGEDRSPNITGVGSARAVWVGGLVFGFLWTALDVCIGLVGVVLDLAK